MLDGRVAGIGARTIEFPVAGAGLRKRTNSTVNASQRISARGTSEHKCGSCSPINNRGPSRNRGNRQTARGGIQGQVGCGERDRAQGEAAAGSAGDGKGAATRTRAEGQHRAGRAHVNRAVGQEGEATVGGGRASGVLERAACQRQAGRAKSKDRIQSAVLK